MKLIARPFAWRVKKGYLAVDPTLPLRGENGRTKAEKAATVGCELGGDLNRLSDKSPDIGGGGCQASCRMKVVYQAAFLRVSNSLF